MIGRLRPSSRPLPERAYRQIRLPIRRQRGKGFYAEYNYKLWRHLRNNQYEAINAVDLDTLLPAALAARRRSAKLIYDAHEWFTETPEVVGRPLIKKTWERLGRWLVPRADLCYTVGPELAKKLSEQYRRPFGVVRNVPRATTEKIATPEYGIGNSPHLKKEKIILYQGMLNRGRGLAEAIAALRQLPPEYVLWLVGDGDITEELRRENPDLIRAKRLVFHGFVGGEALVDITRRAWLGLNLLDVVSPSYYYSLANKCFDYLQVGLPSLQMNFPEYAALEKSYGGILLINRLEPDEITARIRSLELEPQRYGELAAAARKAGRSLTWENEEQALLTLWDELR